MSDSDLEKAVKEISKDIDTLKALKEKLDSVCPKSKEADKALELQKVQILDNYYGSWFNFMGSIAAGGLILLITVSATVYFTISIIGGFIGFGLTAIAGVYILVKMKQDHRKQLEKINRVMNRVENEESLPSVTELVNNP